MVSTRNYSPKTQTNEIIPTFTNKNNIAGDLTNLNPNQKRSYTVHPHTQPLITN